MTTKENYITASFIDSERKNIEILLRDEKQEKVIPTNTEATEQQTLLCESPCRGRTHPGRLHSMFLN